MPLTKISDIKELNIQKNSKKTFSKDISNVTQYPLCYIRVFILRLKGLVLLLFNHFICPSFSFSFFAIEKRKKRSKRKRKHAAVFYALTGIGVKLFLTSTAGPASRFFYAHYGCLRTTFAACALLFIVPSQQVSRIPSPRGRVRVGADSFCTFLRPKYAPYLAFTPNVTQWVLSYIRGRLGSLFPYW